MFRKLIKQMERNRQATEALKSEIRYLQPYLININKLYYALQDKEEVFDFKPTQTERTSSKKRGK